MHILPDLEELESSFPPESGVVVIGVHSAKFDNEKLSKNIQNAVSRYGIRHPVVNDCNTVMWDEMGIQCWPTLVVVGPENRVLLSLAGEGHGPILQEFVAVTLEYFAMRGMIDHKGINITSDEKASVCPSPLKYPGKICVSKDGKSLAISDSAHHRIIVADTCGHVKVSPYDLWWSSSHSGAFYSMFPILFSL